MQNCIHHFFIHLIGLISVIWPHLGTSLVAQMVKRLPTMREMRVQSLDREDLLEKEMATHSSILTWKNSMDYKKILVGYSSWGHKESDMTE